MKKQFGYLLKKGIGLLELMLSLAIIAILLIMATRYYQSASNSQRVSQALDMFSAIKGAVKTYYTSSSPNALPQTIGDLVSGGYLPTSYQDAGASTTSHISPWGTNVVYTPAGSTFTVSMIMPDTATCTQVANRVANIISAAAGELVNPAPPTACTTETTTATFSLG
jgi:type II secretory pathway pseudopilin PulG